MEAILVVLIVLVIVAVAIGSWYLKQARRDAWRARAAALGLSYAETDPFDTLGLGFKLLSLGDGRGVENVAWGTWRKLPVRAFDYWYYETSTDSRGHSTRHYRRFTCAVGEMDAICPSTTIEHEGVLSRLADFVGFRDQAFENEEFNRTFQVSAADDRFASYLIDARMMEWLLASGGDVRYELRGTHLLVSTGKVAPDRLAWLLGRVSDFLERVPRVVRDVYGGRNA